MTQSEEYFERFCERRNIPCRRVPEAVVRTPDYEIRADDITIVVEVKQIEPNAKDRKIMEELARGNAASQWVNMSRARQSILDGIRQLRAHVQGRQPGLVVLCEVTGLFGYLDGDSIAQCLYGPELVHVAVPADAAQEPWVLGGSYGGGRIATDEHSTTLSAVAVLEASARYDSLTMFHNTFAAGPIEPQLFRFEGVRHFAWRAARPELLPHWVDVTPRLPQRLQPTAAGAIVSRRG